MPIPWCFETESVAQGALDGGNLPVNTRDASGIVSFEPKGILEAPSLTQEPRAHVERQYGPHPRGYHQAQCGVRVTLIPRLIPESCFHVTDLLSSSRGWGRCDRALGWLTRRDRGRTSRHYRAG
jgi:hypothetical protein